MEDSGGIFWGMAYTFFVLAAVIDFLFGVVFLLGGLLAFSLVSVLFALIFFLPAAVLLLHMFEEKIKFLRGKEEYLKILMLLVIALNIVIVAALAQYIFEQLLGP